MHKVFLPLISCLLGLSFPVLGQNPNFAAGFYLDASGDTVRGFFNREANLAMSRAIRFRADATAGGTVYLSPAEVSEVNLTAPYARFLSIPHAYAGPEGEAVAVDRFAEQLVAGDSLDLYRLDVDRSEVRSTYAQVPNTVFYVDGSAGPRKLEVVESRKDGQMNFQLLEPYKGVLRFLMAAWPEAARRIPTTRFTEEDLAELVTDFNRARGAAVTYTIVEDRERRVALRHAAALFAPVTFTTGDDRPFRGYGLGYLLKLRRASDNSDWEVALGATYLRRSYERAIRGEPETIFINEYRLLTELNYFPLGHRGLSPYAILGATSYWRTSGVTDQTANFFTQGQSMNMNVGLGARYGRFEGLVRLENRIFSTASFSGVFDGLNRRYLTVGINYAFVDY